MFDESDRLRMAITPFIERIINEKTRECLRTYKAMVVNPPNESTGKCEVRLVGQQEVLSLPYSTDAKNVAIGQAVWVATTYNSWRNAIVFNSVDFKNENQSGEIYPVGSVYISVNSISPASIFGGNWERIEGKFLLGADDAYTLGTIGGAENHTLTINEMPSHSHALSGYNAVGSSRNSIAGGDSNYQGVLASTGSTGKGEPFSIMPPYLAVYMWKRIE